MNMTPEVDSATETYLALLLEAGCKIRYKTLLFGKPYAWLTDRYGVWFLERIPDSYA